MMKNPRVLAGTTLVTAVIATSLAIDAGSTAALWQLEADVENTGTITTGALGLTGASRTVEHSDLVSLFTYSGNPSFQMYEIDVLDVDHITLITHATPIIEGTGLNGAVVEVNYHWPATAALDGWTGLTITPTVSSPGTASGLTPRTSGLATTPLIGLTMQVLVWPANTPAPTGWSSANTITYDGAPPTVNFSLRFDNANHSSNFVLGAANATWGLADWNSIDSMYYPRYPQMGTATLTVRQINSTGALGRWSHSETVTLPVIFNASDSRSQGTTYTIPGMPPVVGAGSSMDDNTEFNAEQQAADTPPTEPEALEGEEPAPDVSETPDVEDSP